MRTYLEKEQHYQSPSLDIVQMEMDVVTASNDRSWTMGTVMD